MKPKDILLIILPFILSAAIIFGHYTILNRQSPKAHSRPLISRIRVESINNSDLSPVPLDTSLPKEIIGTYHEIPTNKKQLKQLLELMVSENANTLFIPIGLTIDEEGNLYFPKALDSSEEMLNRWVKKSVSDAHRLGLHTYIALMFIENLEINDVNLFLEQLSEFIDRWGSVAQEYHVSFFDPGITLGHTSFQKLEPKILQQLIIQVERKTRETYTGRIGIGMCCEVTNISPRGYNHILIISNSADISEEIQNKAVIDAERNNVEHIFLLNLDSQRISTLK